MVRQPGRWDRLAHSDGPLGTERLIRTYLNGETARQKADLHRSDRDYHRDDSIYCMGCRAGNPTIPTILRGHRDTNTDAITRGEHNTPEVGPGIGTIEDTGTNAYPMVSSYPYRNAGDDGYANPDADAVNTLPPPPPR